MTTWATTDDVKRAVGLTPADTVDDQWLAQVTAAANAWATRRRSDAGYDDPEGGPVLQAGGRWTYDPADPNVGDPAPGTYRTDDPAAVTRAAFADTDASGNPTGLGSLVRAGWSLALMDDANVADSSAWSVAGNVAGSPFGVAFDVGPLTDAGTHAGWATAIVRWFAPEAPIDDAPDVAQGVVYLAVWAYRTRGTAGDRAASFADFGGWTSLPATDRRLVFDFLGLPRPVVA